MSIKVMSIIWERSERSGSELLLLLALADHADDSGNCYPSVARLAAKTRMSERSVQYMLRSLVESGELQIQQGGGRSNTNIYRLCPPPAVSEKVQTIPGNSANLAPFAEKGCNLAAERVQSGAGKGATAIAPEPSIEPSIEPAAARAHAHEGNVDAAVGRLCRVWEEATGTTVTALVGDHMASWLERLPEEAIAKAIRETGVNGARAWKYTSSVLERYATEGWKEPPPKQAAAPPRNVVRFA